MTQDELIDMAKQAGFNVEQGFLLRVTGIDEDLERFAKLVAAKEREACAKLCGDLVLSHPGRADLTADQCAAAIRARGQA